MFFKPAENHIYTTYARACVRTGRWKS